MHKTFNDYRTGQALIIMKYKRFQTSYGPSYLLETNENQFVWSNAKVTKRIRANLVKTPFKVIVGRECSFKKLGKVVKFKDVIIP